MSLFVAVVLVLAPFSSALTTIEQRAKELQIKADVRICGVFE